ncbi:MAG TPA: GAF domain-containing protein, partial [Gemmatimonadales bacterium]|nr:GAF domain-containing protein [Gemmatimonadales bacterium]
MPGASYAELQRELSEAREQQTATAEILRVISSSPTDVQPVFDTIVNNAPRLCGAKFCILYRFDGELLHLVAHHNVPGELLELLQRLYPMRPWRQHASGRAIMSGAVVEIEDALSDPEYQQKVAVMGGWRSMLAVPMLRERVPIGAIVIQRAEAGSFPQAQIALIQTFADQAVIAIENVRLFKEVEEKNRALTDAHAQVSEALDQQTATAEILRVISSSPTKIQPVFDTIAESAVRLCDGLISGVYRFDGDLISFVAHSGWTAVGLEVVQRLYPRAPSRETQVALAILDRTVVEVRDFENDPDVPAASIPLARALGYRSILVVPMLREGNPIGAIAVGRGAAGTFSAKQIELLQTFADQAVIAIENVRLFTELREALEQQTATSQILGVISRSPTDVQPVFEAIVKSAVRLCDAAFATVNQFDGQLVTLGAHHNLSAD